LSATSCRHSSGLSSGRWHIAVASLVSVNNDDFANPQAKFFEVLDQLTAWLPFHPDAQTTGTSAFMTAATRHHFPGLGIVRKYQLMHHLELIGRWLQPAPRH
ncbi:hypothetical protein Lpp126_04860, partial [Lacticaseibacillus paracasei subsp. paracasei Lpp126]